MSEPSLLVEDIKSFLIDHAYGSAKATPRRHLLHHLNIQGHSICDRRLRKIYGHGGELEGQVGSSGAGIFWIVTAEDRAIATDQLHGRAMAELVRERELKDAGASGEQGSLF